LAPLLPQIAIYIKETIALQRIPNSAESASWKTGNLKTKSDLEPRSLTLGLREIACGESTSCLGLTVRVSVGSAKQDAPSFMMEKKSHRPRCREFQISIGNKGVDQLVINFFSKCGISIILFPLILASLCMTGCLEKAPELSVTPSVLLEDQPAMQMNFDAELRSDLFGVRGNIMLPGNSSLAYLMLNATLCQGEREQFNTKYLLMQIEPNRDYSFEINKNVKIPAGEYDCILEAKGTQGVLAKESRRISLANPWQEQVPWPVELDEEISNEVHDPAKVDDEALAEPVAMASKESGSTSAGGSLQASSTLSKENGKFMGSIASKKYHRLDCRYALKIKPENRIYFQSIKDATGQGYLPCKTCAP